ncbi:DNA mismatch repair protein MutS [Candidatus Johnevansia muelleri]|uniref:DNA mismatch repair protein MutS n=1 Tax=Candidatus Johnevansia muelleri TaxID=1495769 RepID=A0A078KBH0_9GAMM|nr:DNA mismatch repair protein MutS [Candidatus Evansia muelleri]
MNIKTATPIIEQYLQIKKNHMDVILFFRMGDFYELFFEDAKCVSVLLDITLTSRGKLGGIPIPMAGIPYHSLDVYISKLVRSGKSVAICEQIGEPTESKKIMDRQVVRIITPGTLHEESLLNARYENILISIYCDNIFYKNINCKKINIGLSWLEISSGRFGALELEKVDDLLSEISRISPSEILISESLTQFSNLFPDIENHNGLRRISNYNFNFDNAKDIICKQLKVINLNGFGVENMHNGICAAGALLNYVFDKQRTALPHIMDFCVENRDDIIIIDSASRKNLEINYNLQGGTTNTLFTIMDTTMTAMGSRLLRRWLNSPLRNINIIETRQNAISLILKYNIIDKLRNSLKKIGDIERIISRIALKSASPRDIARLRDALIALPEIFNILSNLEKGSFLDDLCKYIVPYPYLEQLLCNSIVKNPPTGIREGGVIKKGYDQELDDINNLHNQSANYILNIENKEKARTGFSKLKVSYNRVNGYFIEIPKEKTKYVPDNYIRKQTLKNSERFIITELKIFEEKILSSKYRALTREKFLYEKIIDIINFKLNNLYKSAKALSNLDVLTTFAERALTLNLIRPKLNVNINFGIKILEGRHIIVENICKNTFISNDLLFDEKNNMKIITGPNMGGKSTYMRQNALIVLLSYTGSFVPAKYVEIGSIDKIFTRIGSSDDIASGRSTFMIEMNETANILHNATSQSLVLIDEIGRGTSTFDGLALAWASAEDLANRGTFTLFATHYFEITELENKIYGVSNIHMSSLQHENEIIFMYKIKKGPINHSYGIHVAKLAGIPINVILRAREILVKLENK